MSQTELANRAGVTQPTIAAIEGGTQRTSRALPRIARALKVADVSDLDPDYPKGMPAADTLDTEAAAVAFEVILEKLRPDYTAEDRQGLARVFLDLALEPLDENISISLADQMRLRLQFPVRPYLKR